MFGKLKLKPKEADDIAMEYDAYYGDSSPLVPAFVMLKNPVMIANYDCYENLCFCRYIP